MNDQNDKIKVSLKIEKEIKNGNPTGLIWCTANYDGIIEVGLSEDQVGAIASALKKLRNNIMTKQNTIKKTAYLDVATGDHEITGEESEAI